jgi:hypothetical protein
LTASLGQILAAVRALDAAVVGEVAGYLVLGAADVAAKTPVQASLGTVFIDEAGDVRLQGPRALADEVEQDLRDILGWLLDEVRSPFPNLRRVAERPELRGLSSLITELEAALVPVNRRAARRSLSRLAREAQKSSVRWEPGVNLGLVRRARPEAIVRRAPLVQPPDEPPLNESVFDEPAPSSGEVAVGELVAVIERNPFSERPADFPEPQQTLRDLVVLQPEPELADPEDEPTLIRASVFEPGDQTSQITHELVPAPRTEFEPDDEEDEDPLPPDLDDEEVEEPAQLAPELVPKAQEDFEFDVEFEDFEPLAVAKNRPVSAAPMSAIPATLPSVPPPDALIVPTGPPPDMASFLPSAPPSARFRTVRPRSDVPPPSGPLLFDSEAPEGPLSDIGSLLAGLRRDPLPRDDLYRALSTLTESEPPLGMCQTDDGPTRA